MTSIANSASMNGARNRVENALGQHESRDGMRVRDHLVKYYLTGDYASHLRTESVMLIRAALARSADDLGQVTTVHFSSGVIEGLALDTHPMALTLATVLAAGGLRPTPGRPLAGRSSYALIKASIGGFDIGIGLSGHIALMDPDQYGSALSKLQG